MFSLRNLKSLKVKSKVVTRLVKFFILIIENLDRLSYLISCLKPETDDLDVAENFNNGV